MTKIAKLIRLVSGLACIVFLLLLALGCLDIYIDGNSPENLDAGGVHIAPVFSVEAIAERAAVLTPILALCLLIVIAAAIALRILEKRGAASEKISPEGCRNMKEKLPRPKALRAVRAGILALGCVFIVLGVMNGGARDVLIKAINICTECIGLG